MKWVYRFEEGRLDMKALLGGKGAGLADMKAIGLPVSDGFTVTTEACKAYYDNGQSLSEDILQSIHEGIVRMEAVTKKHFGGDDRPLLVSVRSGAAVSMPGMMDTILNLGLNDQTVEALSRLTNNPRFAYDCYRRFIQMYSDVVLGIPKYHFEHALEAQKAAHHCQTDSELSAEALRDLIAQYKVTVLKESKQPFPQDPKVQLQAAIISVFKSWNNHRAILYRKLHHIPDDIGTAVTIQEMVFGNMGDSSGTGVAFTRNPSTGEGVFFGEYLMNAQGEDVVAGIRTPKPIAELQRDQPAVYDQFVTIAKTLEQHYKDVQDIEFTIEMGKLYMLQTRNAKRTAKAALKIAVDLVAEGVLTKEEALLKVDPAQLQQLMHPTFDEGLLKQTPILAKGLPASPGAACGKVCFETEEVLKTVEKGFPAILVRQETSPEDIEGMIAAAGVLTARGGMTSHAAVVARGMGRCCIAGCHDITVEEYAKRIVIGAQVVHEGDWLSLNGSTGALYLGQVPTQAAHLDDIFQTFLGWASAVKRLGVYTNADCPKDALAALEFGAEGIGLCRTEHMFFEEDRIPVVRKMILSPETEDRLQYLQELKTFQKKDFIGLYEVMEERPVTIRLLDPPLHEFLPTEEADQEELASDMGLPLEDLIHIIDHLKEFNPMLGHRGVRLAVTYPEIYEMQVDAIIEAAHEVSVAKNIRIQPEIMIPLVGFKEELYWIIERLIKRIELYLGAHGIKMDYHLGTMIEVPRAALLSDEIAQYADFFSYGTNDLTQMTLGFSRDDSGKFIGSYQHHKIFERDPFESLDQAGVGLLIDHSLRKGRSVKQALKAGVCGEHGGDPASIDFFHRVGLDYVSCSPYRVPVARLAAAQAAIKHGAQ